MTDRLHVSVCDWLQLHVNFHTEWVSVMMQLTNNWKPIRRLQFVVAWSKLVAYSTFNNDSHTYANQTWRHLYCLLKIMRVSGIPDYWEQPKPKCDANPKLTWETFSYNCIANNTTFVVYSDFETATTVSCPSLCQRLNLSITSLIYLWSKEEKNAFVETCICSH